MRSFSPPTALLALAGLLAGPGSARAETYHTCKGFIDSVPATISTQGTWCLRKDLATAMSSGNAITINTNNVTIDCNDFKLGGLAAGAATNAAGIYAANRINVGIRHCNVRGFLLGIYLGGGAGHLVEDNRVDLSTLLGIYASGDGLTIRRNRIADTGGRPGNGLSRALEVTGPGTVTDNVVVGVTVSGDASGNGNAIAINLIFGPHEVSRNFVTGVVPAGSGQAIGIYGPGASGPGISSSLNGNTAINAPAVSGYGIILGVCRDNTVIGYSTGFSSCTDAGGNVAN